MTSQIVIIIYIIIHLDLNVVSYKEMYCHYKQGKAEIAKSGQIYLIK